MFDVQANGLWTVDRLQTVVCQLLPIINYPPLQNFISNHLAKLRIIQLVNIRICNWNIELK